MESEKRFAEKIKKATGIPVNPCNEEESIKYKMQNGKGDVFADGDFTFFKLKVRGADRFFKIDGNGNAEKKYALLIMELSKTNDFAETTEERDVLREILLGDATEKELEKADRLFGNGLAVVMKLCFLKERTSEIENFLDNYLGKGETPVKIEDGVIAIIKVFSDGGEERNAPSVYAKALSQAILEEFGERVTIGLGSEAAGAEELFMSYVQAGVAIRFAREKKKEGETFGYKDFVIDKLTATVAENEAKECFSEIFRGGALEIFKDKELFKTAETFLDCDLNLSETARKLFLHRNTLFYRLNRIERITGLDLKNFDDAVTFRLATLLYKRLKRAPEL